MERLAVHLKPLQREGRVQLYDDTKIQPCADLHNEIKAVLVRVADAVVDALDGGREHQAFAGNVESLRDDDFAPFAIRVPGTSLVESPFAPGKYFDVSGYRSGQRVIDPCTGKACIVP